MADDLFDPLLNLEDMYYQDGYRLGVEDGSRAGRIEGRTFGLEKGFEKFFEMGKLQGRSLVWEARLPGVSPGSTCESSEDAGPIDANERTSKDSPLTAEYSIKHLPGKGSLAKHIRTLIALSELESLSTENSEEAVSDFDDRYKRAVAKMKVIENIVGEKVLENDSKIKGAGGNRSGVKLSRLETSEKNIEDFGVSSVRGRD